MNIAKFPLDPEGKELPQLGLMMHNLDYIKVPLWPFIDEIKILKPPKAMQLGVGFNHPKPVQVTRYMNCVIMSGDNPKAQTMIREATHTHISHSTCM
jgi:hypothetical protein